jgi:phosphocarrier protein
MIEKDILISNPTGLHARPASDFILEAKKYQSTVTIAKKGEPSVNGKSIMKILSLGIVQGDSVHLCVNGPDEAKCFAAIEQLLAKAKD